MTYTEYEPDHDAWRPIAETFGVSEYMAKLFISVYICRFKRGASVFLPWYHRRRKQFWDGKSAIEPPFPHEVFPDLTTDDRGFYAAFKEGREYA